MMLVHTLRHRNVKVAVNEAHEKVVADLHAMLLDGWRKKLLSTAQ